MTLKMFGHSGRIVLAAFIPSLALAAASGLLSNHDLRLINRAVKDPANVVFKVSDLRLDGFSEEINAYYRVPSVRRTRSDAKIRVTNRRAGSYYPSLVVYDSDGRERFEIWVAGRLLGEAVADWDNSRQRLFFAANPVAFRGGEVVEIRALGESGMHRVESVVLLREKPEAKTFSFEFFDVRWFGRTLTWRTNWATACTLEFDGSTFREPRAQNNHRMLLDGVTPGREFRYRITARGFEGESVSTGWKTIRAEPPAVASGSVASGSIPLTVQIPGSPVTAGIPFPKGELGSDEHLRLVTRYGVETPLQTKTLARWEDRSVKWALLDFQSREPAFRLEYGTSVMRQAEPSELHISDEPEGVIVSTGPITFRIGRKRFGFLEWLEDSKTRLTPARERSAFYLTAADGEVYDSLGLPDEVVVEEHGPVRACVRVSGRHYSRSGKTLFRYIVRFHAWAGRRVIRVQHTFENDSSASEFTDISSLVLRMPLEGRNQTPDAVRVRRDSDRKPGRVRWRSGGHELSFRVRDFWQNYPKDLVADDKGFEFGICPRLEKNEYVFARGTIDEHRLYYYLRDGMYRFRQGMSKTHDFWIGVGGDDPAPIPSMAAAPPGWYAKSGALGHLAPPSANARVIRYDAAFKNSFQGLLQARENDHAFGMMNFGDWWGERDINWGNCEYDTQHALFLQFARTGGWQYFRAGEQAEWHNRDVDTVHRHSDPVNVGGVWEHKAGHTGGYFPGNPNAQMAESGDMTPSHTFIEGHFDYYFLTGDTRSVETARATADRYSGWLGRNYDMPSCRNAGWLLILAMAAYNATNDPYYRNFANIVFERVLELQTEDGGWRRKLARGHCDCRPRHMGNVGFMVGVLMSGLRMYYEATGDERAADSIVKAARFLVADMWMPGKGAFRYTSCPRSSASTNSLSLEGIAFAYAQTSDPSLLEPLRVRTERLLDGISSFGKSFSQDTRQTPRFIDFVESGKASGTHPPRQSHR